MVVSWSKVKNNLVELIFGILFHFFYLLLGVSDLLALYQLSQWVLGTFDNGAFIFRNLRYLQNLAVCWTNYSGRIFIDGTWFYFSCKKCTKGLKGIKRLDDFIQLHMIFFRIKCEKLFSQKLRYFNLTNLFSRFRHLNCDFLWFRHQVIKEFYDKQKRGEEVLGGFFGEAVHWFSVNPSGNRSPEKSYVFDNVHITLIKL